MPAIAFVTWTFVQCCWARARDDRGSASVEHILWYVAAAVGTVAVAAIVWAAIKAKAEEPLPSPSAP